MGQPRTLFVTGKLAEPALRQVLARIGQHQQAIATLPISVVALATTSWIASHLEVPEGVDSILIPGLCRGELSVIEEQKGLPVIRGPADLRELPDFLGQEEGFRHYGAYDISILAEINFVQSLSRDQILTQARAYKLAGADVIDLGCNPGATWSDARDCVLALRDEGFRVSIDSFNYRDVEAAVGAGAELVLSVNRTNLSAARSWGCEVVVIPDEPKNLQGLDQSVERLLSWRIPFRIDPVLEPIGFGFAASLANYFEVRRRYPQSEMLMGVANLTELTDVDSAGINVLLLAICQEVGIRSVLTTQVINWCRSSVRELDHARRLVHYACKEQVLPKHLQPALILLRDPKLLEHGQAVLQELAAKISDKNLRIFAEQGTLHVINDKMHLQGKEPFELFRQIVGRESIDPAHAFYLGYEMAKAVTALTLGKNYTQDQSLRWGFLTLPEQTHPDGEKPDDNIP
jgi:dihydropteroate synthase-like protein